MEVWNNSKLNFQITHGATTRLEKETDLSKFLPVNEIEDILTSHSAILEAAVVGWPSKEFGQEIAAFVMLKPNETHADVNHIKEHCRQNLATYKVPRGIFIVNELLAPLQLVSGATMVKFAISDKADSRAFIPLE